MGRKDESQDEIEAEAARWVVRLEAGPLAPGEQQAFARWQARSGRHAAAYAFARRTWETAAGLGAPSRAMPPHDMPTPGVAARGGRPWLRAGLLAALLLLAAGGTAFWYGNPLTMLAADHWTGPGEQQSVTLPDGSQAELAPASALVLRFDSDERRVELLQGAAYFIAAPRTQSEPRPFVVQSGAVTATALGTQFLVDRLDESVSVTVAEHQVGVTLFGAPDGVVLSAGQSARYTPDGGLGAVEERNPEQAAAWRRGRLIFDQVPLSEVAATLNRYRRGHIAIMDSALAGRLVSGVFEIADLDGALDIIARELDARVVAVPPLMTLLY